MNVLKFVLLPLLIAMFAACSGQNTLRQNPAFYADVSSSIVPGDTVSELGNNIMVIYHDQQNNYWFGSWETGLYRYDGKTILHFTTKHGLPVNRIDEIKEDKAGNLYINTAKGICKFDGKTFTELSVSNTVSGWKLEPNDLWFKCGWESACVLRYDGKTLHKLKLPTTKLGDEYILSHPNISNPYDVYCVYNDSKGNIWFGTAAMGACCYNGKTFQWISEDDVTELHNGPANGVRSIIEDKDGYFWFNANYRYDVYGNKSNQSSFYSRSKSIGSLDGIETGNVSEYLSIARDKNNKLWFETLCHAICRYNVAKV